MAPVLSLNPKAEVTTLPPKIINPEDVVSVEDHIIKSLQQTAPHLGKIAVEDSIKHLGKIGEVDAYSFGGQDVFSLKADNFQYVLYRENPKCWKTTYLFEFEFDFLRFPFIHLQIKEGLELINTDSLEVKGSVPMQTFVAGRTYEVIFWFKMNKDAQFDSPCKFTLVIADGPRAKVAASSLSVVAIQPEKLVRVKLGEFTGTGNEGEVRFSLTNFDPNWKSGIVMVGLFIQQASA